MACGSSMVISKKLAYLNSLTDQLLGIWQELGGKYADKTEDDIHAMMFSKGRCEERCHAWTEYTAPEQQQCISFLRYRILPGYQKQLKKKTDEQHEQWRQEKELKQSGLLYNDMVEASLKEYNTRLPAEIYEQAAFINGVSYFKKREKPIRLVKRNKAYDTWRFNRYDETDHEFPAPLFEEITVPGFSGTYFKPLFDMP